MNLTFEPGPHTYRVDGRVVPSVTQLLDKFGRFAGVPESVLEAARSRGTYAHALCEAKDLDDLDEARVPDEYRGYLAAWQSFLSSHRPNWEAIEERGYSQALHVAGTLDRRGTLEKWGPKQKVILDIKTGEQAHPVFGLQLAAYRAIVMERDAAYALARRITVQLANDGRFKLTEWTAPDDFAVFAALARVFHWGARHAC